MHEQYLQEHEIVVSTHAVKYHDIEYHENYIVVTQHRTRRRVYKGYYFEDTGAHIYVSTYCSGMFQCKRKVRNFILDKFTKEWRENIVIVEHHVPERIEPIEIKPDESLIK